MRVFHLEVELSTVLLLMAQIHVFPVVQVAFSTFPQPWDLRIETAGSLVCVLNVLMRRHTRPRFNVLYEGMKGGSGEKRIAREGLCMFYGASIVIGLCGG